MPCPIDTTDDARRPRLLVVEPDERVREPLAELFHDAGYDVVAVPHFAAGINAARNANPAVIVTELRGGQVIGPGAYVQALQRHTPAPIVAHTDDVPGASQAAGWRLWGVAMKGDGCGSFSGTG